MTYFTKHYSQAKQHQKFNLKCYRHLKLKEYLKKAPQKYQIRRFKNYCELSGTSRSYYSQFALSRHCLRKFGLFGSIPGLRLSSW